MLSNLILSFPNFNLYSTPLLILTLQGLIFSGLLYLRYFSKRNISDLLLASILLITCYHRTTYTIGFMDWYDTYRNTKVNYYLVNMGMIVAPLIYFYVRSITRSNFKFKPSHFWHFMPWIAFFIIKMVIFWYDAQQLGFSETQNGYLIENFQWKYLDPIVTVFSYGQMLIYLAFTFQMYFNYRKNIQEFFSNTYRLELNWIRNFLVIYSVLFLYGVAQTVITNTITELSWTQKWWLQFFNALAIIYVGVKGYFTDTERLSGLEFNNTTIPKPSPATSSVSTEITAKMEHVSSYFEESKPYLNPELNLINLSEVLNMNRGELSEIINLGFDKNFNDFVNTYRVEAVKNMLKEGKQSQLSLLGIAFECGFNSKATFNRVFKKISQKSPTQFLKSI